LNAAAILVIQPPADLADRRLESADWHAEHEEAEMAKRMKARVQKSARVFVHNDLSNAALHFADVIKAKQANGQPGILIDGMACAVMVAFTFEANVNFMGFELNKASKLPTWKERESFDEKVKKVFGALGIAIEKDKRPLKSMERMKELRDTLAHGKPAYVEYDQVEIGTAEEIDLNSTAPLLGGWQTKCTAASVFDAREDLEALWKLMIEKSGLELWDTMTTGDSSIDYIEDVL
jgi:hypothetical protein